jgi:hypothetical protein
MGSLKAWSCDKVCTVVWSAKLLIIFLGLLPHFGDL